MKTLNVSDQQASIIAKQSKGDVMLFLSMMVQPPDGWELNEFFANTDIIVPFAKFVNVNSTDFKDIMLKYPTGTTIGIRETWGIQFASKFIYKVSVSELLLSDWDKKALHWHSSATMPSNAIRSRYEVIGTDVKRVQDITAYEAKILGWLGLDSSDKWVKQWFNSKYAKPRPVRKNGEIVKYVSYMYDDPAVVRKYLSNVGKNLSITRREDNTIDLFYKGKPLEIIVNPCLNLVKGVKNG